MKEIKCLDCDKAFQAETSEEALEKMKPHYMSDHKEMMEKGKGESKKAWFEKFKKQWTETKEL